MACPFCSSQKASKKLYISLDKGIYHCWKESCPAKQGNIVDFYAKIRGLEWKEAYKEIKRELKLDNQEDRERKIRYRVIEEANTPKESNIADIEKRHFWYSLLLSNRRCSLKEEHLKDLVSRGFTEEQAKNFYASVPDSSHYAYFDLTAELQKETGGDPSGIPGFFIAKNNKWCLSYTKGGIMIPMISFEKKIQGITIRTNDEERSKDEDGNYVDGKFSYITSPGKEGGCQTHTFIHYACDWKYDEERKSMVPYIPNHMVVLIEGPMKADLFYQLTGQAAIAVAGVSCLNFLAEELEKLKSIGVVTVLNGYDMDYLTNPNVQKAQRKAEEIIKAAEMKYSRITWNTEVNGKNVLKGIDDYYAFRIKGIIPVTKNKKI